VSDLPLETAATMNDSWGYHLGDRASKSTAQIIRLLVNAAGRNANLLLNVGPMPTGEIQPEFQTRLREVGRWTARFGESIYGTRGGPVGPRPWGVTTQRENRVYVHVLDWADPELSVPALPRRVRAATLFADGSRIAFRETPDGIVLVLPPRAESDVDRVVVLELAPEPATAPPRRP